MAEVEQEEAVQEDSSQESEAGEADAAAEVSATVEEASTTGPDRTSADEAELESDAGSVGVATSEADADAAVRSEVELAVEPAVEEADDGDGPITDPAHLDVALGAAAGDVSLGEEEMGVVEALQAWSEGGHAEDEFEDAEDIAPVQFAQLDAHPVKKVTREDRLNNVLVKITVELGRKHMSVDQLLNLKEQDCIELDKLAGEAFDILINKRAFAEGEIVVVTDLMAVRITRLRDPGAGRE